MLQVRIYANDEYGTVTYYPETKDLMVVHPNVSVRERVNKYLKTKKSFTVPMGNGTDLEHKTISEVPVDSQEYIELALCTMYSRIEVYVDWTNPFEEEIYQEDDAEQSISVNGDELYDIIN